LSAEVTKLSLMRWDILLVRADHNESVNPLTPTVAIWVYKASCVMQTGLSPQFVIFDIGVPGCQKLQMTA